MCNCHAHCERELERSLCEPVSRWVLEVVCSRGRGRGRGRILYVSGTGRLGRTGTGVLGEGEGEGERTIKVDEVGPGLALYGLLGVEYGASDIGIELDV